MQDSKALPFLSEEGQEAYKSLMGILNEFVHPQLVQLIVYAFDRFYLEGANRTQAETLALIRAAVIEALGQGSKNIQ